MHQSKHEEQAIVPAHTLARFADSRQLEKERIAFLEQTRGQDAARAFARQTLVGYRRAVVNRSPPARDAGFRLALMGSYCYLKQYLADTP